MTRESRHSQVGKSRFADDLIKWHADNRRSFPWREDPDPYLIFLAEVFLQRTPAERVASFLEGFLSKYPSPSVLASADLGTLERELAPLGLRKRARWLVDSAALITEEFNESVPDDVEDLVKLPGVGPYTAAAIASFGYGKDVPAIDVNVVRVVTRVFRVGALDKASLLNDVEDTIGRTMPLGRGPAFNEAMLDLAALVCRKTPICHICPVSDLCDHNSSRLNGQGR